MEPWFRLAVLLVVPLVTLLFRRDFRGQQHIPRTGGCIVATNHISYADPFGVALFVYRAGRRPRFMAKFQVFKIPLLGRIVRGARQIPVYRESADAGAALSAAVEAIDHGECVVIYPEATVTKDPDYWPMLSKTGVARLALATGAPVVPVAQWGAQHFLGRDKRPRLGRHRTPIHVRAGAPLDLSAYEGREPTMDTLRELTNHIMSAVTDLLAEIRDEPAPPAPYVPDRRLRAVDERRTA